MKKFFLISVLVLFLAVPVAALAQTPPPSCDANPTSSLCNPVAPVGGNEFRTFVIYILRVFASLGGIAGVVFVVFSGFRFITSQGNEEKVAQGKQSLQWTLMGLAVMILSYVTVASLQRALDFRGVDTTRPGDLQSPIGINTFSELYKRLIDQFFIIMGLVAVLILVINGFKYMTARGNEEQASQARSAVTYAVLGIVISLLGYVIVQATARFFGAK